MKETWVKTLNQSVYSDSISKTIDRSAKIAIVLIRAISNVYLILSSLSSEAISRSVSKIKSEIDIGKKYRTSLQIIKRK